MKLDWFTVAAQIGNFLLLLWLLKRFLYRPILAAMAARQQRIADALATAQAQAAAAEALQREYLARQQELATSRETWLTQAREEVAAQRQIWLTQARVEVDALRERWRAELGREQQEHRQALQREASQRLLALARRALRHLGNTELEAHMASALLARLRTLDDETRQMLAQAARDGCAILTAFPLPESQQRTLTADLRQLLNSNLDLDFRTDPAAPLGITLETPSQRLAWTLDSYLDGFAAELQASIPPGNLQPSPPAPLPQAGEGSYS
ncbi:MAG: F0F1 ATP synthase subunit B [Candidatus Contendobacter sp.]|nr:F0F1 ATP synthase subunit B [Candidatus Contendobacter sp.]